MEKLIVKSITQLRGTITLPGDKSISHRAVMLGALAQGVTRVRNLLTGEDCLNTIRAFKNLGIKIKKKKDTLFIHGQGLDGLRSPSQVLDVGNSGTTIRLLSGILAGQTFRSVITGDKYLKRRPMKRIIIPLQEMGAKIAARDDNFAPLIIDGGKLHAINYISDIPSAQVKSCILLAGLYTRGNTSVTEPVKSRDHTERMLKYFGAKIKTEALKTVIQGGSILKSRNIEIPGDISSAGFFIGSALILPNSKITLRKVGVNPTRMGLIDILKKMGAKINITNKRMLCGEPIADLIVETSNLKGTTVSGRIIPRIIDEIPILVVVATQSHGKTIIRQAKELRVKETDRIHSITTQMVKMGAKIRALEDGMVIEGPTYLHGAKVSSFGDHRTAMSLVIAGLIAGGETIIQDTECIKTSFPDFIKTLNKLSMK